MRLPLHNGRVLSRVSSSFVALVAAAALLAACSNDDNGPSADSTSTSTPPGTSGTTTATDTTSPSPSLPVPAGVELTTEGSQLHVGDKATVAYQLRQGVVGVLDIKVTRLEKTSFKKSFSGWQLDDQQKKANPYFVHATVTNRGETDLGGKPVPLYIVDGHNTLIQATTFASSFPPCQPGTFPTKFKPGHKLKACLVFLSPKHGDLTAVSFRPTQEYDPITWTGELEKPKPPKPPKGKGGQPSGSPTP
jgi:hypothetical protein